jgi:predicted short-subunit dehydrogenase-like oxidoreductase (DUF2520 family)
VKEIAVRTGSEHLRQPRALAKRVGAQMVVSAKQPLTSDIVWVAVPDDAIADVGRALARTGEWKGKTVFHSSGALTSEELAPLRAKGARVASVHPMMTFVRGAVPDIEGVAFALEGDVAAVRAARSIIRNLGGRPFTIKKENKVLYHVFGSFASPLVIALMASMEEVALAAGIRRPDIKRVIEPLLQQTLRNYFRHNAASAFSGPLARGDVATVRGHRAALKALPQIHEVYVALAKAAARTLPVGNRQSIEKELLH